MFIGHFGVAFAAKKLAPRTSLPVLIFAAEFIDVLWPAALIAGIEHVRIQPGITSVTPLDFYYYPWTHSLLMVGLWAVAFGAVYYIARRYLAGAITCAALVLSHWFLDLVVHRPDLPLMPGSSAYYGLELWHSRTATAMVELTIFFVGVWLYISATSARDKTGGRVFWALVVFLLVIYAANIQGNAPPSVPAVAWSSLVGTIILFLWAWWADAHRQSARS